MDWEETLRSAPEAEYFQQLQRTLQSADIGFNLPFALDTMYVRPWYQSGAVTDHQLAAVWINLGMAALADHATDPAARFALACSYLLKAYEFDDIVVELNRVFLASQAYLVLSASEQSTRAEFCWEMTRCGTQYVELIVEKQQAIPTEHLCKHLGPGLSIGVNTLKVLNARRALGSLDTEIIRLAEATLRLYEVSRPGAEVTARAASERFGAESTASTRSCT